MLITIWGNLSPRCNAPFDRLAGDITTAMKADEVAWGAIVSALKALEPSNAAFVPNSARANDAMAGCHPPSAYDRDPTLGEGRKSGGGSRDRGESPSRECRLSYDVQLDFATAKGGGVYLPSFMKRAHLSTHPLKRSISLDLGEIWTVKVFRKRSLSIHRPLHRCQHIYSSINFVMCILARHVRR